MLPHPKYAGYSFAMQYKIKVQVKEEIQELNHMYASSRHAKIVLLRDDREVVVHFYALSVQ